VQNKDLKNYKAPRRSYAVDWTLLIIALLLISISWGPA
jgi:hypothetical protein